MSLLRILLGLIVLQNEAWYSHDMVVSEVTDTQLDFLGIRSKTIAHCNSRLR